MTSNKCVRCVETGVVYESMQAAGDAIGRCRSAICQHVHGKSKHVAGLHFVLATREEYEEYLEKNDWHDL